MKKAIMLFLVFSSVVISMNAQVILLKFDMSDCAKCQVIINSYVRSKFSDIPAFLIFPDHQKEDSTEIKKLLNDTMLTRNMVFSTSYYKMLDKIPTSSIAYLSSTGTITYQKSIMDFHQGDAKVIDSLYSNDVLYKTEPPAWVAIEKGKAIKYNPSLNYIKVQEEKEIIKYSLEEQKVNQAIETLNQCYPGFYDYTRQGINLGAPDMFFRPKMGGYCIRDRQVYYSVKIPFAQKIRDEKIRKKMRGDSILIQNKHALIMERPGMDAKTYAIEVSDTIRGKQSEYIFAANSFTIVNDTTFLFLYYPVDWKKYPDEKQYIAVFKLRKSTLQFDKHLKNEIPDIYLNAGIGYGFSIFKCIDYPYYVPSLGTEILDLKKEQNYKFEPDFSVNYGNLDSNFTQNVSRGKIDYPIYNMALFHDVKNKRVYLFSRVDKIIYLSVFSTGSLKLLATIDLNKKGLNLRKENAPYVGFDEESEVFLIEDNSNNIRGIPISLLDSQQGANLFRLK